MNESRRKVLVAIGGIAALTGCTEESENMSEEEELNIDPDDKPPNPNKARMGKDFEDTTNELLYHIALNVQMIREELQEEDI